MVISFMSTAESSHQTHPTLVKCVEMLLFFLGILLMSSFCVENGRFFIFLPISGFIFLEFDFMGVFLNMFGWSFHFSLGDSSPFSFACNPFFCPLFSQEKTTNSPGFQNCFSPNCLSMCGSRGVQNFSGFIIRGREVEYFPVFSFLFFSFLFFSFLPTFPQLLLKFFETEENTNHEEIHHTTGEKTICA